jgi:hypothetical protein
MANDASGANKMFDFLMKLTDLFSHFMGTSKATSSLKVKPGKKEVMKGKNGDYSH